MRISRKTAAPPPSIATLNQVAAAAHACRMAEKTLILSMAHAFEKMHGELHENSPMMPAVRAVCAAASDFKKKSVGVS